MIDWTLDLIVERSIAQIAADRQDFTGKQLANGAALAPRPGPRPRDTFRRMALARELATWDDLLALPEDTRAELLAGEILVQPGASSEHQYFQAGLSLRIGGPFGFDGPPGGWWILPDVDVRFTPHDVVRPDHSGWRRTRLASPFGKRPIDVVPDWICEILSSSNSRHDRGYKSDLYATHGVRHYWLVDTVARLLEAYELQSGRWLRLGAYEEHKPARIPPFDAVELALAGLFPPTENPPQ